MSTIRRTSRVRPGARSSARRGFTLLEVVLASVLGLIVIIASLALFETMDRARRMQAARLETNTEFQMAHKVFQQTFRTLLMEASADPRDDDLKTDIEKDIDDALSNAAATRRDDAAAMRFALQPDTSGGSVASGVRQTLDVTLTTPPIHGTTRSADAISQEDAQLHQLALARQREVNVWNRREADPVYGPRDKAGSDKSPKSSSSERETGGSLSRAERLRLASGGLTGTEADPDRISALASQQVEPPRAPGVRGVFELRPEDDQKILARSAGSGKGAWALWWKQIPFDDSLEMPPATAPAADRARALAAIELARAESTDGPEIKLLSGLSDAHWQVYRRRKMVPKMAARYAKELPAYVEFKFETLDGRHEDWLFEVAWSYGAEPGTVVAVNDPLGRALTGGGDDANSIGAAVQAAIDAANGGGPGRDGSTGGTANTGSTGSVASTGGGKGQTGGATNTGAGGPRGGTTGAGQVSSGNGGDIIINLPGGGRIVIPGNSLQGHR